MYHVVKLYLIVQIEVISLIITLIIIISTTRCSTVNNTSNDNNDQGHYPPSQTSYVTTKSNTAIGLLRSKITTCFSITSLSVKYNDISYVILNNNMLTFTAKIIAGMVHRREYQVPHKQQSMVRTTAKVRKLSPTGRTVVV